MILHFCTFFLFFFFFFNDTATTEIYTSIDTLSLHDALPISTSSRASLRALSASSTAWRMRSRRSSIVFWIGPNAYLRSTKNVIANAISVQIIRPGTTSIRPESASTFGTSDQHVGEETTDQAV